MGIREFSCIPPSALLWLWAYIREAFVITEITCRQRSRSEIYVAITHRIVWTQFLRGYFPRECQQFLSFLHQSLCRSKCVGSWRPVMGSIWPTKNTRSLTDSCNNDICTKQVNTDLSRGDDFYSSGLRFASRPGQRLYSPRFSVIFLNPFLHFRGQ